jgi:hypothetical protein
MLISKEEIKRLLYYGVTGCSGANFHSTPDPGDIGVSISMGF